MHIEEVTAYVSNNYVNIICPVCNAIMRSKLKEGVTRHINITCKACRERLNVTLCHRVDHRKSVEIKGRVFFVKGGGFSVQIKNISQGGLGFIFVDQAGDLSINDTVHVKFLLCNTAHSEIDVTVRICHTDRNECGGVFLPKYSTVTSLLDISFWLQ